MYGKTGLFKQVAIINKAHYSTKGASKKLLEFLATMPKDNSMRISDAQRQRQIIAKKYEKLGASTIYLQALGSGARGAPNTLYLFTDQTRYLFNCGEGSQRLAHEHKVRLSRLEHIFVTSKTWKNIGGLPGVSLTLQDVGVPNITLHGPEGLDELYNATRRFVIMKDMNVKMANCSPSEDFSDNVMSVKYVLLGPDENLLENDPKPAAKRAKLDNDSVDKTYEEFIHDDTDYYNKSGKNTEPDKNTNLKHKVSKSPDREQFKTKTQKVLTKLQKKSNCTVAYICTFKKRFGTLDLKKCVERGVKPGPLLGKLKMGEDVVLPDGTLVLSKDVKTPDDPGPVLIVLEVPDLSYLKEAEFSAHFDNGANPPENIPAVVVHYTPPHVFHHPTYRAFMSMFGPTTRHLVLNEQNSCLGSEAVHRTQHKLHLLDAEIFPLLRDASVPAEWRAHAPPPAADGASPAKLKGLEELKNKIALAQFQNIISMEGSCRGDAGAGAGTGPPEVLAGRTLSMFHLRPKREFDRSAEPKLLIQDYIQETMDVDGFAASLEQFRKLVDGVRYARSGAKDYPKVVFLGTGSCIPSKTRNTSAIALHVDEERSMLLDCGEGTFGQLVRFYGPKRVNAFLRTLKAIYISHLHADHHIGLIGVLQARRQAFEETAPAQAPQPLQLLAPGQIVSWLATYDAQFERIRDEFTLVPNQNLLSQEEDPSSGAPPAVLASIGVQGIRTCYVAHCPNAFGVAIDLPGDHRITYSGDTIPCDELVRIGENSTLLIHEATMEDELADEARVKMHSTTSQAIEMGRRMRAAYTVLTHFSQRYARLPRLNAHILNRNTSVGIAFDNMQITMSDLELLPHMYAPLQLMFAEHCVELEMKAAHRAAQKARKKAAQADNIIKEPVTCQVTNSAPAPRALPSTPTITPIPTPAPTYRDSNASRLRQEIRRMAGRAEARSKSCSSTKSPRSATPKSNNSENVSPERSIEVTTPRTPNDSSNMDKEERSKLISKGHVIDTRSKTLSSASASPSTDKLMGKKTSNNCSPPKKESGSGYGKPLLTPVNRHPLIRRYHRTEPSPVAAREKTLANYMPTVNRCRSPVKSWKAENRPSSSSIPSNRRDLSKNKILPNNRVDLVTSALVHLVLWRLFRVASRMSSEQWQWLVTVVSVGVLFWTAAKETGHAIRMRSNSGATRPDAFGRPKSSAPTDYAKSSSPSTQHRLGTSPRRASSVERKPQDARSVTKTNCPAYGRNIRCLIADSSPPLSSSPRSQTPTRARSHLKEDSTTKCNKQMKNIISSNRAKFINHSSKSFKPQLEDIKSSDLLLNNKKNINRNINAPIDDENELTIPKSPLNDDNLRRMQLMQIKSRYKSKQFWNDSKYDKIEGLNWITWI